MHTLLYSNCAPSIFNLNMRRVHKALALISFLLTFILGGCGNISLENQVGDELAVDSPVTDTTNNDTTCPPEKFCGSLEDLVADKPEKIKLYFQAVSAEPNGFPASLTDQSTPLTSATLVCDDFLCENTTIFFPYEPSDSIAIKVQLSSLLVDFNDSDVPSGIYLKSPDHTIVDDSPPDETHVFKSETYPFSSGLFEEPQYMMEYRNWVEYDPFRGSDFAARNCDNFGGEACVYLVTVDALLLGTKEITSFTFHENVFTITREASP